RCDRCKRLNIRNDDCPECKITKDKYMANKNKGKGGKRGKKPSANGQEILTMQHWKDEIGKASRMLDHLAHQCCVEIPGTKGRAPRVKSTPEFEAFHRLLGELFNNVPKWYARSLK